MRKEMANAILSPISLPLFCTLILCFLLALFFSSTFLPTLSSPSSSSNSTTQNPFADDDDDALLRRASLADPNPAAPFKIAFMFLTTTPLPLSPIWELFFHPNQTNPFFNIYIHADPSRPYDPPFSGVFSGRTIPSQPTRRSDPSLISAARRLLAQALLHDPSNAMFALLSPSCIPLRPFSSVYRTLTDSTAPKSFIEILSREPTLRSRYEARGSGIMLREVQFESFRVGSQFFVLSRRHARLVVNDTKLWAKFKLPCRSVDTCYPEEHYFTTLLSMEDPRTCVPATLTHVDWRGSRYGHPRTYRPEDVGPGLINGLRSGRPRYGDAGTRNESGTEEYQFLFARKFSPTCLDPLLGIASDVLFRE